LLFNYDKNFESLTVRFRYGFVEVKEKGGEQRFHYEKQRRSSAMAKVLLG
jgi:hypothetical protein